MKCFPRILLVRSLILLVSVTGAQNNYRTGISGFYVPERGSLNIGFTALDMQRQVAATSSLEADLGMRFIGATTGRRGGYFAFGYFSEVVLRTGNRLRPGISVAFLAGGGAAAPDFHGWMIQSALFAKYAFEGGAEARAGLNHSYVSRGIIAGFSPLIGLSWDLRTGSGAAATEYFTWNSAYAEAGVASSGEKQLGFIGAGAVASLGRQFSGEMMIHTLTNDHGGYMQALASAGPHLAPGRFYISPALLLGIGGGGSVRTIGGGLYGIQGAVRYSGRRFFSGLKYQYVRAVSDRFAYSGFFLSAGKTLDNDTAKKLSWDIATKAYVGTMGFGNIGARFTAYQFRSLRLMGSTFWAFTHEKGAYAEGLFEASLTLPCRLPFYVITSVGAGAGSGINQSIEAVIYSIGAGFAVPWSWLPVSVECNYWEGGNLPALSLGISYRVRG